MGQGIIRGLGKQGLASIGTFAGYYCFGMPISLLAVFYIDGGIVGLWWGPSIAIVVNFFFYYGIIFSADWEKIALEAEQRRIKDGGK